MFGLEIPVLVPTNMAEHCPEIMACHVIVHNRLSLSMGSRVVAAGANLS